MTDWYDPNFSFRRRLVIVPPAVQPIEMGFPLTVMVENDHWHTLGKLREDDLDIRVTFIDQDIAATPVQVAVPHKIVYPENEEHMEMIHVTFNAEMDLVDIEMATPSINMDYYMYYGNRDLLGYVELPFTNSDYIIKLTPDDYNFSLTFSRPTEHWISGLSDKINARFALNFFGFYARLTMEKGPDRGIMELRVDDEDPIYIDTYAPVYTNQIVYTTNALLPENHAIRCRITGDKNAASESHVLQFVSFEYSVFVEAIEGPEEINPANVSIQFLTGT